MAIVSACASAQNMEFWWSRSNGSITNQDVFNDLAENATTEEIFAVGTRTVSGNADIVVTKQDRRGIYLWTQRIALSANDQGRAIDVRPNGNVVVTGSTLVNGFTRLFLAELNSADGSIVWQRVINSGGTYDSGHDVKVAADGSLVVAGGTSGLLGLIEVPTVSKFNSTATSEEWSFNVGGIGTARHLVLDGSTVFYAGERRVVEVLGIEAAGNAFVGRCNVSDGNGRNTEAFGVLDLTYERIHKLEPAGPGRVLFSGWKGISLLGQGAIPVYGTFDLSRSTGSEMRTINGGGTDTVATDIAYSAATNQFAVLRTSSAGGGTGVSVQVGDLDVDGNIALAPAIPLPGGNAFAHSVGFTPDAKWYAYYVSNQGGAMALGKTQLESLEPMERITLGWSAIGLPASEHPPQARRDRTVWVGGDSLYGGRVASNSYQPGPEDVVRMREDAVYNADVLRNDGIPFFGVRAGEVTLAPLHGTASITNGRLTYTPAPNFFGSDRLSYRVSLNGTTLFYVPVTITVLATNDAPTVLDQTYTVRNNAGTVLNVLDGSFDVETPALTVSAITQPSSGTVSIHGSRTKVTYKPVRGFVGTVTFTYTGRDRGGLTATGTVTLNVTN